MNKEQLKRQKYNPDNIFIDNFEFSKKDDIKEAEETRIVENTGESIWKKIVRMIKNKFF